MRARSVLRMLRDRVHVRRQVGVDEFGQAEYEFTPNVPARVVHAQRRAVSLTGDEFISSTQVVMLEPVKVGDALDVEGVLRPVMGVKRARGVRGGVELVEAQL